MTWGRVVNGFGVDGDVMGPGRGARPRLGRRFALVSVGVVALLGAVACQGSDPAPRSIAAAGPTTASTTSSPPAVGASHDPKPVALHRRISGNRPLRILIAGDSVGATFARGMRAWAVANGNAEVFDSSRMWCALGRKLPISHGLDVAPPGSGCDGWGTRWPEEIRQFDPDVVFVYFSIWEMAPRQLPGSKDLVQPGFPALDAWQLSEYQAAADILSARGAPVVWFTIPCENAPIETGTPLWQVNRRTVPKLAASRPAVHVVDLDHELCHNGPSNDYAGVHNARPDGAHLSDAGALAVAKWVMPIVLGDAPNPQTVSEM